MNKTHLIAALNAAMVPRERYASAGERWITIGAKASEDGKRHGGTPVKLDGRGRIVSGPNSLQGKTVKAIKDAAVPKTQVQHAARSAAKKHGLRRSHIEDAIEQVHSTRRQDIEMRERAKVRARQLTGLNAGDLSRLENTYRDHSSVPHIDEAAQVFAMEHPELRIGDPAELWEFIRQGRESVPAKHSEEIVNEAVEIVRAAKASRKATLADAFGDAFEAVWDDAFDSDDLSFDPDRFALVQLLERELYGQGFLFREEDHPRNADGEFAKSSESSGISDEPFSLKKEKAAKTVSKDMGGEQGTLFGPKPKATVSPADLAVPKPLEPLAGQKELTAAMNDAIKDFGERIEGARKHQSRPLGQRPKKEQVEAIDVPAWQRRYRVTEDAQRPGQFFIVDDRQKDWLGKQGKVVSHPETRQRDFSSYDEAAAAIPQIEARRNHGIGNRGTKGEPNYAIYRNVTDRKRPVVRDGFKTYEEAQQFLKDNPATVIEHQFPDYETYQYLDDVQREGPEHRKGDVKPDDFQKAFNFRGGQFGNWNQGKDGQTSLNHAYDALHDLADVTGLPAKAIALNGDLAIAFGARGTGGKHSARAHYEPEQRVINLTKMKGAGSLGHEWAHGLDHYLGELAGAKGKLASNMSIHALQQKLRPEVSEALKGLRDTISSRESTASVDAERQERVANVAHENLKRQVSQLEEGLKPNSYRSPKPFTPDQQKQWDAAKAKLLSGDLGKSKLIQGKSAYSGYDTYEPMDEMNKLYKASTGRSFHTTDENSVGRQVYWAARRFVESQARLGAARNGATETKRVPTEFYNEAVKLDETRAGNYYTEPHEMLARAFEGYIDDKLTSDNRKSQYLSGKADNKHYAALGMKPFPEGEERKAINAAFDKLFAALKHEQRSDDRGDHVRLYSLADEFERAFYAMFDESKFSRDRLGQFAAKDDGASGGGGGVEKRAATPSTEELLKKKPVAIAKVSPQFNKRASAAEKWAFANLQGKSYKNRDAGMEIKISRRGLEKALKSAVAYQQSGTSDHFEAIQALPELLENAVLAEIEPDRNGDKSVNAYYKFYAPLDVDGRAYRVKLTVRELADVKQKPGFYTHELASIEVPARDVGGSGSANRTDALHAGTSLSVSALLAGAKRSDGTLLVPEEPERHSLREMLEVAFYSAIQAAVAVPHKFSSTQINLPSEIAAEVLGMSYRIPDADLAADGRETQPHVTVKYGLNTDNPEEVARIVRGFGPIRMTLGKTSIFNGKGGTYDVVKIGIVSPDLHRMNKQISDALPHTDTHPTYQPHITLAYVKPGLGKRYAGNESLAGTVVLADSIVFSDKLRNHTNIPLGDATRSSPFSILTAAINRQFSKA